MKREMVNGMREIPGFDGYYVSSSGEISHEMKDGSLRNLSKSITGKGYLQVAIARKSMLVHRCVAIAWLSNLHDYPEVNHKDGNKKNNNSSNLEWTSRKGNMDHAFANGLHNAPRRPVIGTHVVTGASIHFGSQFEAQRHGFDNGHISRCIHGKRKTHKGYRWRLAS